MQYRITSTALVALSLYFTCYVAAHAHHENATSPVEAIPACFTTCGNTAATDVGCSGISDVSCYCGKEDFVKASARCTMAACPDLSMNTTLTTANFKSLEGICTKATGKFNLTIPTLADMGMANASMTASASGSVHASKSTSTDAAPSLQPPMAHVVSACLVLSALVAGSSILL